MSAHGSFDTHGLEHCPFWPSYGPPQLMLERGLGTEVWDASGKRYLDFLCGLAVTSLGHAHPEVAEAIADQAAKLLHVSNLFANPQALRLAVTIDELMGGGGQSFLCNSGAEANEAAIKVARRWAGHGRHVVISAFGSFHGRTLATLHMTGQPAKHESFQPLPEGFRHAAWADVADLERMIDPTVAAIALEPIQGEGGVMAAPSGYFADVKRLCVERDLLFIVDDVQTGFGRTGRWFGWQHFLDHDSRPDVVTLAKALGNGMPIGACWAKREVAGAMKPGDHGSTYGGTALASAAANAVIAVMKRIDAPALALRQGDLLAGRLRALPGVSSVRGLGLLLGVELAAGNAKDVQARLIELGVITNAVTPTALRMAPPITVSDTEIDEAVMLLAQAIRDVEPAA